jgi:hypothetical protein
MILIFLMAGIVAMSLPDKIESERALKLKEDRARVAKFIKREVSSEKRTKRTAAKRTCK